MLAISAIGSSIGCFIAGAASHAVMSRVEEGHGKFILFSAAPSSQSILWISSDDPDEECHQGGNVVSGDWSRDGDICRFGLLFSSVYQGKVAATGIQATANSLPCLVNALLQWGLSSPSPCSSSCSRSS